MLLRFKYSEVTFARVGGAIKSRLLGFWEYSLWLLYGAREQKEFYSEIKGKYEGGECFIVANGPSINKIDMRLLSEKVVIGMNRSYMMEGSWGFLPDYLVCINDLVLRQFSGDLAGVETQRIFSWSSRKSFKKQSGIKFVRCKSSMFDGFSIRPMDGIYTGGTVTYACLQLAYDMGFKRVYIIGLDHNFDSKGVPNKTEVRVEESDSNHFHPNYFPKGVKWQLPDLLRSEIAYQKARDAYEADGREIIDLTVGGKCRVFKKGDIRDVLGSSAVIG